MNKDLLLLIILEIKKFIYQNSLEINYSHDKVIDRILDYENRNTIKYNKKYKMSIEKYKKMLEIKRKNEIKKLPSKEGKEVAKALDALEKIYKNSFSKKFKTITFDNGPEFRNWKSLEKSYDKRKKGQEHKYIMLIHTVQENEEAMKMQID